MKENEQLKIVNEDLKRKSNAAETESLWEKRAAPEFQIEKSRAQIREFEEEKKWLTTKLQVEENKVESIKKSKWQATQVKAAFVSQGLQGISTSEFQIGVLQNKVFAGTRNDWSQDTVIIIDTSKWEVGGETTICRLKHCIRLQFCPCK